MKQGFIMHNLLLPIPSEWRVAVKRLAKEKGLTMVGFIRELIRKELVRVGELND